MCKSNSNLKPTELIVSLLGDMKNLHGKITDALASGMINDNKTTDEQIDQMKRTDEYYQKAINIGEMLTGVIRDSDWDGYFYLTSGYAMILKNVWQRIGEIDKGVSESEYAPFAAELPLKDDAGDPRTVAEGLPYWKYDLDEWLNNTEKAQKIEQYRHEIERIPVLLEWRNSRNNDETMVQPLFTAIDYYVATLHRDCAIAISNV